MMVDALELGQSKYYFHSCVSKKYDKKDGLMQKYTRCRFRLKSGMLDAASKALAGSLPDTTTGLKKAYAELWDKYKGTKYGKCRLMLNPEMTLVASREMASSLPDSPKGLELACEALNKKFKNSKQVKEFEKYKVEDAYEANKGKSPKIIYQAVKGRIAPDQKELGKNAGYFEHCTSVKGDLKTKRGLEKYGKCRLLLNPEMTLVASREMASSLPDSPKGLGLACEALNKKFKNSPQVKEFEKYQYPNYYDKKIRPTYEAMKDKDSKSVRDAIYSKILVDALQLEFHKESVPACGDAFLVTEEYPYYYDKKLRRTYEAAKHEDSKLKYARCRFRLTPDMLDTASKALADSLPDTTTGLQKAYAALKDKYKGTITTKRFGDQYPNYYERKIQQTYEALKDKDSNVVRDAVYPKILSDSQQLGNNRLYFQRCKYAKCRFRLTSDMLDPAAKALADNLPDTTTGLQKAYAALRDKYKDTTRVKRFGSCLGM
nr:unnamed protein product [Callosobruchus analis]